MVAAPRATPVTTPVDETEETARNAVQVTRIDPAAMDRDALAAVDLLLLDHPGRIEADGLSQIASLLRRGRGVLYVAAEAVDATNLRQLAEATGGRPFQPRDTSEVKRAMHQIALDIRTAYTIGYVPANAARDGRFRRIRVIARAPDRRALQVRTRQGYVVERR